MIDATVADGTVIPGNILTELTDAFGLGRVEGLHYLPEGLMNANWRLAAPDATFALKRVADVPRDRLSRNLGMLASLAADGVPVSAPVATASGALVAEADGGAWYLFPWMAGVHVRGVDLSLSQASLLGAHLGRLHEGLGRVCDQGLLPVVPETITTDVTTPERAVQKSERLSAEVRANGTGSPFDEAATAFLEHRRALITKHAGRRPQDTTPVGSRGWTHGDVQYRNLLWEGGELVAILDWDRVGVRPYAEEVARTAQVQFGVDGVFDLARVSAFVRGYRSVVPLELSALADGVRRLWWKRMTDFWQLEFHYDRGDFSFDELFTADEALLRWWTDRLGQVEDAFAEG
ncbi:phosphotransferase [Streptomyces sp. NBC_01363]|uniref:phosphotransferase n=1 Tax=Streptomyces sp. NBC_01363 TaxID=2903840 RepID=UPI00225B533C|nr:phosphotransferase [Streptomyces sp. NBC_01363]MCX4734955.1 phosphotransferase [Streptomyces sp. NBC_01363]